MMLSLGPLHPVVVMRRGAEGETGGGWWEKKKSARAFGGCDSNGKPDISRTCLASYHFVQIVISFHYRLCHRVPRNIQQQRRRRGTLVCPTPGQNSSCVTLLFRAMYGSKYVAY